MNDTTATQYVASYALEGHIEINGPDGQYDDLGYYDADGAEWEAPLAAILERHGYKVVGPWTTDADYTSTASVIDTDA
jgi:hypothetical protein